MTVERSKRRCFLTLTFIVKSVSKSWLIRIIIIMIIIIMIIIIIIMMFIIIIILFTYFYG